MSEGETRNPDLAESENRGPEDLPDSEQSGTPGFMAVALSVIAAAFGVQTDKNRQRDFSQGNPLAYIVGGLIFTILFVLAVVGVVMLVLQ